MSNSEGGVMDKPKTRYIYHHAGLVEKNGKTEHFDGLVNIDAKILTTNHIAKIRQETAEVSNIKDATSDNVHISSLTYLGEIGEEDGD